ncbi:MAG: DUF3822 family protein [Clostridium sp.]|nr:DUF3822 family protein [Clostridium sp.]
MQATGNNPQGTTTLSIRISTDGFSFYVFTHGDEYPLNVTRFPMDCDDTSRMADYMLQCLREARIDLHTCTKIYVLADGPSTRIPLECFHKDNAETLYRLTFPNTDKGHKVFYNILPHVEVAELFALPRTLSTWLFHNLPDIRIYGQNSMLLEKLMLLERKPLPVRNLYVHVEEQKIFIALFQDRHLRFANTYTASRQTDRLYFILHVWKILELNAEKDHCILLGNPFVLQETSLSLTRYLRHVEHPQLTHLFPRSPMADVPDLPVDIFMLLNND